MITFRTQTHVDGLKGEQVYGFLMSATDREYQAWWPGVHLHLHTFKRCPNNVGNMVYMDEFIGEHRVKMTGVVVEAIPGRKLVWQLKKGVRLPVRLSLELHNDEAGVLITHSIRVGFEGLASVLDPAFRIYFSAKFAAAMDEHVKTEFPKLRDMLVRIASGLEMESIGGSAFKQMPAPFWVNSLLALSIGVALIGLAIVATPGTARRGFSLLVYAHESRIDSLGETAASYISLAHAVLGSVLLGWGSALFLVVGGLLARGSRLGWRIVTLSLITWFVPDTTYSLCSGYWQNAVVNLVFASLFAIPLLATYHSCNQPDV